MPFVPELFSARALARLEDKWRPDELVTVPYFDGLMAGEPDALVVSFAAEPELHDPVCGGVKGTRAFKAFVTEINGWIARRSVTVENVEHVVSEGRGFEEVTSTQIEPAVAGLYWLNKCVFVSVGGRLSGGVIYETYLVR